MRGSRIFGSWLNRRGPSPQDWQDELRQELLEQQTKGASRRELVEDLARRMYAEDLHDLGAQSDLGFFSWQLYLGAAQFVVNYLLPAPAYDADNRGETSQRPEDGPGKRVA